MNLVESKPILKIEKEKQGNERQQFNIKRNELVESGKYVVDSDDEFDYVIKKNQVVQNDVVYDNLDYDLDIEKNKKKEEIEKEFVEKQLFDNSEINEALAVFVGLFGYKKNKDGLIVFNSGITKFQVEALLHEWASKSEETFEYLGKICNNKETALGVLSVIVNVINTDNALIRWIRRVNSTMNTNILNKKKKTELLAQLEVATTLEEVQAIDVEKAKQEVQIELAGLTGLNGVEGVEGL